MKINRCCRVIALLLPIVVGLGMMPTIAATPRILTVTGKARSQRPVMLKRNGWTKYQPVKVGAALFADDLLEVSPGTEVIVLCPDGKTRWRVPAGEPSGLGEGCPGQAVLKRPSGLTITALYGGSDSLIPYVVLPRNTAVLTDKPLLRWNPVPGVTRYVVKLRSRDGMIWSQRVAGTQIVYPGNPPLRAGVAYSLVVEAANGRSSLDEKGVGYQFNVLDRLQVQQIQEQVARLEQQRLPDDLKVLYLVDLYRDRRFNLLAEAIVVLEGEISKGNKTPINQRLLADLYWQVGLKLLAENTYQKAIKSAQAAQDLEVQADAAFGLGNLYVATGERTQASHWFKQALSLYQVFGDDDRVRDLQQRLDQVMSHH